MLALPLATHLWYPATAPLARNDVLTICAVLIQIGMLAFRLESRDEAKVILAFHVTGKLGAWYLLMIVSFVLVSQVDHETDRR